MNNTNGFLSSLVTYTWKRIKTLPINWWNVGTGTVIAVIAVSAINAGTSLAWVKTRREIVEKVVKLGDYSLAQKLYEEQTSSEVLGADAELEDLVYPERKIEQEITKHEELNEKYPGSRDILLTLSDLYLKLGEKEKADVAREQARILDPNNEIFR